MRTAQKGANKKFVLANTGRHPRTQLSITFVVDLFILETIS